MKKLEIYTRENLLNDKGKFIEKNAFIRRDGSFYLAKGYTGCNPWHQLESSALWVGRQEIGEDFVEQYKKYLEDLKKDAKKYQEHLAILRSRSWDEEKTRLRDKRSILVHFYGFVLFCRTEYIRSFNDRAYFTDTSLIPYPEYYGQEATMEQKETLETFFDINEGQNVAGGELRCVPNPRGKDAMLKLVYDYRHSDEGSWHK